MSIAVSYQLQQPTVPSWQLSWLWQSSTAWADQALTSGQATEKESDWSGELPQQSADSIYVTARHQYGVAHSETACSHCTGAKCPKCSLFAVMLQLTMDHMLAEKRHKVFECTQGQHLL